MSAELISVVDAAKLLNVSTNAVYMAIKRGKLKTANVEVYGKTIRLLDSAAVNRYAKVRTRKPKP